MKFRKLTDKNKIQIENALDNLNESIRNYKLIMDETNSIHKRAIIGNYIKD